MVTVGQIDFLMLQTVLPFVAVTFFSFIVSVLFVAVGLDKIRKPLHLLVGFSS